MLPFLYTVCLSILLYYHSTEIGIEFRDPMKDLALKAGSIRGPEGNAQPAFTPEIRNQIVANGYGLN